MKTGAARTTASGWMTSIVPTPVPTPRPLRKPANTDQIAPATALAAHKRLDQRVPAGHEAGQEHGQRALGQVADDHDRGPLATERPQRIRAAGSARSDRPRVGAARDPGDEDAHRDGAGEVGDQHQDGGAQDERRVQRHAPMAVRDAVPFRRPRPESSTGPGGPSVARLATPRVPSRAMTHLPSRPVCRARRASARPHRSAAL